MISRYEQQRYASITGANPTAHRDDVIRLLQGGKTGAELAREGQRHRARIRGREQDITHLHTPEVRRKRGRAIERAWAEGRYTGHSKISLRKLSESDVRTMRRLRTNGATFTELAQTFGISVVAARAAVRGDTYKDVA